MSVQLLEASASRPAGWEHEEPSQRTIGIAALGLVFYLAALMF